MDDNSEKNNSVQKISNKTQENWLQNRNIMCEWTNYPKKLHGAEATYANNEWINMKKKGKTTFTQRSPDKGKLLRAKGIGGPKQEDSALEFANDDTQSQNDDKQKKKIKIRNSEFNQPLTPYQGRKKSFTLKSGGGMSLDRQFDSINRNALNMTYNFMNVKTDV